MVAKRKAETKLPPYKRSLAGCLLSAREAVMAPIRPILREANLSDQQWRILRVLADEGAMDATKLASSAMLLGPSVTRILRELEARSLLVREADEADGRRQVISVSSKGLTLIEIISDQTIKVLGSYAERFGAERIDRLVEELKNLVAAIADGDDQAAK